MYQCLCSLAPTRLYMFTQDLTCVVIPRQASPETLRGQQFPSVVLGKVASESPGNVVKMQIAGSTAALLN